MAAARETPTKLLEQLSPEGIMVPPKGATDADQHIHRLTKRGGVVDDERLLAVRFVPMQTGSER